MLEDTLKHAHTHTGGMTSLALNSLSQLCHHRMGQLNKPIEMFRANGGNFVPSSFIFIFYIIASFPRLSFVTITHHVANV